MNAVVAEDLERFLASSCMDWEKLAGRTIFVTGATGLIGRTLVRALLYANEKKKLNLRILALVRDQAKAEVLFGRSAALEYATGAVENLPDISSAIDFIIHGASPTASRFFTEYPVETIRTILCGTMKTLQLAAKKQVKGYVYLSSMEVYGAPPSGDLISETQGTTVDTMSVRSCYPEAKRLAESICASHAAEYGVPAMVIRLAQTFGPGVLVDDCRVFAEFARCAMAGEDIVLQTAGTSRRCYLYTMDAVEAILTVLLRGKAGEAYNAANPDTYCSIADMAQMVADTLAEKPIHVQIPTDGVHALFFSPPHLLKLDTTKIEGLGWKPTKDLPEMYRRMAEGMRENLP